MAFQKTSAFFSWSYKNTYRRSLRYADNDQRSGCFQSFRRTHNLSDKNGALFVVLSVDNYAPTDYTAFYNRAEQAIFADYVILMGYDEHYGNSEDAGSTASIGFVTEGVENTLKEVPANQLILGMPFYTRVWEFTPVEGDATEEAGTEESPDSFVNYSVSSHAISMGEAQRMISANGAEQVWLDDLGQYYSEYENNGCIYRIWVEDALSLEEKLKVMDSYQLAGGSFWKLGLEPNTIWDTIIKYIN
ncbi:MAG: hypothetical protein IIU57_01175 [Oscillospiraceae bacterium]|nr:hypothetical protein [Oscillospiraceae bacterium]